MIRTTPKGLEATGQRIHVWLSAEDHRALKVRAAETGVEMSALVREAIKELLGKPNATP